MNKNAETALPTPVERTLFHTRQVTCQGYLRHDGLWDIEGRMVDSKSYDITFYDGRELETGQPLHEMQVRITVDNNFVIRDANAITVHAPYQICPEISSAYQQLTGVKIGPGFSQKVRDLFKGRAGCTHITELLGPMATTAFQTITSGRRQLENKEGRANAPRSNEAARLIDSCHGWRSDGEPVAVQFPERYTGQ